jgi:hypothetical protein
VKNTVHVSAHYLPNILSSVTLYNLVHMLDVFIICHSHTSHKNAYTSCKPVISSLPLYCMLFQAFVMSEGDLYSKTQNSVFSCCSLANIFRCHEPTIHRDRHSWHFMTTMPKVIEFALKWHHECLTPRHWNILHGIHYKENYQILGTFGTIKYSRLSIIRGNGGENWRG